MRFDFKFGDSRIVPSYTYDIIYDAKAVALATTFVDTLDVECQWFHRLTFSVDETKKHINYFITDFLVPQQKVTGTTVETQGVDFANMLFEKQIEFGYKIKAPDGSIRNRQNENGEPIPMTDAEKSHWQSYSSSVRVWCHSHVKMPTNPSGTDQTQWKEWIEAHASAQSPDGVAMMMILNKEGSVYSRIYHPSRNIDVINPLFKVIHNYDADATIQKVIENKVKRTTNTTTYPSNLGTQKSATTSSSTNTNTNTKSTSVIDGLIDSNIPVHSYHCAFPLTFTSPFVKVVSAQFDSVKKTKVIRNILGTSIVATHLFDSLISQLYKLSLSTESVKPTDVDKMFQLINSIDAKTVSDFKHFNGVYEDAIALFTSPTKEVTEDEKETLNDFITSPSLVAIELTFYSMLWTKHTKKDLISQKISSCLNDFLTDLSANYAEAISYTGNDSSISDAKEFDSEYSLLRLQ